MVRRQKKGFVKQSVPPWAAVVIVVVVVLLVGGFLYGKMTGSGLTKQEEDRFLKPVILPRADSGSQVTPSPAGPAAPALPSPK